MAIEHDICWLQVTVDHTALVCVTHRVTDGRRDFGDLRQRQSLASAVERFEKVLQSPAIHILQDHVIGVTIVVKIMHLDDVGVT